MTGIRAAVLLLMLMQLAGCAAAPSSEANAASAAPGTFTAHLGAASGFYVGDSFGR